MGRDRPTSVLVIAVINFVLGGIGLIGLTMQLPVVSRLLGGGRSEDGTLATFLAQQRPDIVTFQYTSLGLGVVFCLTMIGLGVGLVLMHRWAWAGSVAFAVLELIRRVGDILYVMLVIYPAAQVYWQAEAAVARSQEARRQVATMEMSFLVRVVLAALFLVYPLAMLVVMLRPHVMAAFRAGRAGKAAAA